MNILNTLPLLISLSFCEKTRNNKRDEKIGQIERVAVVYQRGASNVGDFASKIDRHG